MEIASTGKLDRNCRGREPTRICEERCEENQWPLINFGQLERGISMINLYPLTRWSRLLIITKLNSFASEDAIINNYYSRSEKTRLHCRCRSPGYQGISIYSPFCIPPLVCTILASDGTIYIPSCFAPSRKQGRGNTGISSDSGEAPETSDMIFISRPVVFS